MSFVGMSQNLERISVLCDVLYCVLALGDQRTSRWIQRAWEGSGRVLTIWNAANFIGGSSKCNIFSELFGEAGTGEDFPLQAWWGGG